MSSIIIIGGGAAGLMAGISAAAEGAPVTILEKMGDLGRKMLITGKGRCNITNAGSIAEIIENIKGNGKFLFGALNRFSNTDVVKLLEDNGLKTKVERGQRVFPVSDCAKDVVDTLVKIFRSYGGKIITKKKVKEILVRDGNAVGVTCVDGSSFTANSVILTTGGASYPGTGSAGDGYRMAEKIGHTIIPLHGSLVPLTSDSDYLQELQGLSLRNVRASLVRGEKILGSEFGEMLFTHFGVSGPTILSLSRLVPEKCADLDLIIDLKPALTAEKLDLRIQRDWQKYSRRILANGMNELLPSSLIPVIIDAACLDGEVFINQITKAERTRLVETMKNFSLPITGTRPLEEAIVTAGGVSVKEINPKTFASKIVGRLFFAGEVMDVDGFTGGFNLQAAFSSGFAAGKAAAEQYYKE